jgi:hypothetical protein
MQNAAVYIREYSIQSNDTFASAAKETHTGVSWAGYLAARFNGLESASRLIQIG